MARVVYHDGNVLENVGTDFDPAEKMTRQSEADQADINKILKRMELQGIMPIGNQQQGLFVDVSAIGDYRSALDQVQKADEYFRSLPADTRAKFANDPALLLDALQDATRVKELQDLGILAKVEAAPAAPPPVEPPK